MKLQLDRGDLKRGCADKHCNEIKFSDFAENVQAAIMAAGGATLKDDARLVDIGLRPEYSFEKPPRVDLIRVVKREPGRDHDDVQSFEVPAVVVYKAMVLYSKNEKEN